MKNYKYIIHLEGGDTISFENNSKSPQEIIDEILDCDFYIIDETYSAVINVSKIIYVSINEV